MISSSTIKKFKCGDEVAFEEIFNEYSKKSYYLALKYTKNRDDSDDCVQEIFIKLYRNIEKFDEKKSSFSTWFYQLSKNCILDYLSSKNCYNEKYVVNNEYIELSKDEKIQEEDLSTQTEIEKIIGKYNYQVVFLKLGYMLTFNEIAEELNISASKAKRIYYNSIELIERSMKK